MSGDDFNISLNIDKTAGTISEGTHLAKCIEAKVEPNKSRDGNNLVLEFEILSPTDSGRKIKMWQSLKESVAWRYTTVLAAFGIKAAEGQTQATFGRKDLVGKKVKLVISHDDYQGTPRAQINDVLADEASMVATPSAPGGLPVPPVPPRPTPPASMPPAPPAPAPVAPPAPPVAVPQPVEQPVVQPAPAETIAQPAPTPVPPAPVPSAPAAPAEQLAPQAAAGTPAAPDEEDLPF